MTRPVTAPVTGAAPPAGAHGGDGAALAARLGVDPATVLDLSASLNPVAPDVRAVVARHLDALRSYPDPGPATAALAGHMGVDADRLVLTNGGAEAIALVAAEHPRGRVDDPDFALYRRHLATVDADGPRWRSNPHNPTGRLAARDERAAVWDEAFWPLATGTWTRRDAERGSTVVGSLTKLLACPGLRVGYALCPDADEAARLARRRPQWSVNGLVCAALPALLDAVDLAATAEAVAGLRSELVEVLEGRGLAVEEGAANWVLVHEPGLRDRLAEQGVLVRDCAGFGLPGTHRMAVPDGAGIQRVATALDRADPSPTGGASAHRSGAAQ